MIYKPLESFAKYIGFTNDTNISKEHIEKLTNDKNFLSDLLTYRDYDPSTNIFINESSNGSLLELMPLVGISDDQIKNLEYIFSEIDQDFILQFLLIASNDIEKPLGIWNTQDSSEKPKALLQKIVTKREDFFRMQAQLLDSKLPIRDFKIFLSISCTSDIDNLLKFRDSIISKFDTISLNSRICDSDTLKKLVLELTNIDPNGSYNTKYDPFNNLNNQIYSSICEQSIKEDQIDHLTNKPNDIYSSCIFTISKYPREFSLKSMINLLGNPKINLGISGRFAISLSIDTTFSKSFEAKLLTKADRSIKSANTKFSTASMKLDANEWQKILDQRSIDPKLTRFFNTNLSILLTSKDLDKSISELKSLFNSNGFEIEKASKLQLPLLLSILPMHSSSIWQELNSLKLNRIRLTKELISLLPICAEYKGMQSPGIPLIGRRGQLFCFNNFVKLQDGNFNACIMAASGSGKSVFLQELVITHMRQNTKCFVLDIGKSFANIAKLTSSEIIEFSKDSKLSINPFVVFNKELSSQDRQEFLQITIELLYLMCGVKEDDPLGKSKLSKQTTYIVQKEKNLDITKFAELLCKSQDEQLSQYGITLFPYTKDGVYGKYFYGSNILSFDSLLTVFEFEEIRSDQRLLSILLQVLSIEITKQFLTGDRSQNFCIIIDEAWMLLDFAAPFFASFARTVRKYNGSLITCVQNLSDLSKTESHKTILKNSAWTILLKQDQKGISSFLENDAFKDIAPLIKSLTLVPKRYAEVLICATSISVVGRLALDEFSKALYSTDAKDFNYIQKATKKGIALSNAIEQLSKRSA